jgi:iron complex transport system ATP-binding protein
VTTLTLEKLRLTAGARVLLDELTVSMHNGENWAILGPNGSGKSTLLRAVAGLNRADHGRILLDDRPLTSLDRRTRARLLSLLFQDSDPGLPLTVFETVLSGRHPHVTAWENEGTEDRRRALAALDAVHLGDFADRRLATLSGGERRRAEIAAVLAQDTPVCLYDEPTLHLDLHHQIGILDHLSARSRTLNLFVLHDLNLAHRFCQYGILLFGDGEFRTGTIDDILTVDNLQRAYRWPMRIVREGPETYFIPA